MTDMPFIPPFPKPLKSKAGLLRRFLIGRELIGGAA